MFYILNPEVNDTVTVLFADENRQNLVNTVLFRPDLTVDMIKETKADEAVVDFKLTSIDEAKRMADKNEQDRINHLTMTSLDMVKVVSNLGVSDADILAFLTANPKLQMMLQLCKDVYCGVVREQVPFKVGSVTITDEMVVKAFEKKAKEKEEELGGME